MLDELFTVLSQLSIVAVFGVAGAALHGRDFRIGWFVTALAIYFLYDGLLTRFFFAIPNLPADSNWNWLGKVMSFVGMLVVASLPQFGFRRVGLTLKQRRGFKVPFIVFLSLIGFLAYIAVSDSSGMADSETIAFQWTMPSLDEELFYRRVLLLAMNEAFNRRVSIGGAAIGYGGLLTSLLFGLAHGFGYSDGGLNFDAVTFAATGIPSLVLLWLRERTGSLLLPMIGHSASNGLFTVF